MSSQVFPTLKGLGFDVVRTAIWSNAIQTNVSGKETRIGYWTYPRYQWDLMFDFLRSDTTNAELQSLLGFFNSRNGSFDSFLYTDSADNSVTTQNIGTGDGTTRTFQLARTFGGFAEPILAPNTVSNVYVDGVDQAGFWTVSNWGSSTPGIITFSVGHAPANTKAVTATFSYYWPVRFLNDTTSFANFMYQLWNNKKVSFISLK
jgi:uncharacterized protein (TIGR02217 family)